MNGWVLPISNWILKTLRPSKQLHDANLSERQGRLVTFWRFLRVGISIVDSIPN